MVNESADAGRRSAAAARASPGQLVGRETQFISFIRMSRCEIHRVASRQQDLKVEGKAGNIRSRCTLLVTGR